MTSRASGITRIFAPLRHNMANCLEHVRSFIIPINISLGGRKSSFIVDVPTRRGKVRKEGRNANAKFQASEIGHKFCMRQTEYERERGRGERIGPRGHAFVCGRP